jgi:hypothetical protein
MHETNPRTSFSNRWFRSVGDTCHVIQIDTCQTSHSSLLPHDAIPRYGTSRDYFKLGGWVENSKITGRAHASTPSSNLLSDLSNEQIRKPSQGLTPVTSSEIPYPAAAPLCLTRVKFPGTSVRLALQIDR